MIIGDYTLLYYLIYSGDYHTPLSESLLTNRHKETTLRVLNTAQFELQIALVHFRFSRTSKDTRQRYHKRNPAHLVWECLLPSTQTTRWLWLVVWNIFFVPSYLECHHPNWRSPSFFRVAGWNQQPVTYYTYTARHGILWKGAMTETPKSNA